MLLLLRYASRTHGPDAVAVIDDDPDDTWPSTPLLDIENDPGETLCVLNLENALEF